MTPGADADARSGVGLCLSGGGFRATLFHLGALRRLNELGVISKPDTISSVSGGASPPRRSPRPSPRARHSTGTAASSHPSERLPHATGARRSEEHTSELQSPDHLVCRLLLEKKKKYN